MFNIKHARSLMVDGFSSPRLIEDYITDLINLAKGDFDGLKVLISYPLYL